jgi:hypothetical protein
MDKQVKQVIEAHGAAVRDRLLAIRQLVFDEAGRHVEIGELAETLKWGQLSFLPKKARVGTTVRFDVSTKQPARLAMYVNCQTSLVDTYRQLYPDAFQFEGNRAVTFAVDGDLPAQQLRHCIALALTYHLAKKN